MLNTSTYFFFRDLRSNNSVDDVHLDQFLKVSNYEDTVKQLDIYYGIGNIKIKQIILISNQLTSFNCCCCCLYNFF